MSKTEPKSWRDVIKVHPAADLFPMMPPDELKALGEDIKANGLTHQIVLWTPDSDYWKWSEADCIRKLKRGEFYLLDGRNRVAALVSLDGIGFRTAGQTSFGRPLAMFMTPLSSDLKSIPTITCCRPTSIAGT